MHWALTVGRPWREVVTIANVDIDFVQPVLLSGHFCFRILPSSQIRETFRLSGWPYPLFLHGLSVTRLLCALVTLKTCGILTFILW